MKMNQKSALFALILLFASNIILAQSLIKNKEATKQSTTLASPRMNALPLFKAPGMPTMAPEEEFAPLINSTDASPSNLPGWGLSKALDYLQTINSINPKQIGVEGHSRWGKTALLAAAMDTRWAAVFASCSGSGGGT